MLVRHQPGHRFNNKTYRVCVGTDGVTRLLRQRRKGSVTLSVRPIIEFKEGVFYFTDDGNLTAIASLSADGGQQA